MVTGYALRINTHTHAPAHTQTHSQVVEDFTMAGREEEFKA